VNILTRRPGVGHPLGKLVARGEVTSEEGIRGKGGGASWVKFEKKKKRERRFGGGIGTFPQSTENT